MQKRIALFPGSFDPFTCGHEDIVLRSLALFDEVIIALGHNSKKQRYFDADKMIEYINLAFEEYDNVSVIKYNELTASLAEKNNAGFILLILNMKMEYLKLIDTSTTLWKLFF
jgi:pantetheine-phosphate adenylyltransferase